MALAGLAGCSFGGPGAHTDAGTDSGSSSRPTRKTSFCTDPVQSGEPCLADEVRWLALSTLLPAREDPRGEAPGFNLDCRYSDDEDARGCFHPDFEERDREWYGIDVQLAELIDLLEAFTTDFDAVFREGIRTGKPLLVFETAAFDRATNGCARVSMHEAGPPEGKDSPVTDSEGRLTAGQKVVLSTDTEQVFDGADVREGVLRATAPRLVLPLPLPDDGGIQVVRLSMTNVRFRWDPGRDHGVLGGAVSVEEFKRVSLLVSSEADSEFWSETLQEYADLDLVDPAEDDMPRCQAISIALELSLVPVAL